MPADHPSLAPRSPQPPGQDAPYRRGSNTSGRDGSRDGRDHGQLSSSEESLSGFPQDIEWTPDHELLGLVTFMRAAIDGRRDSSEDKATAIGVAMHAADPAGAACLVKVMTGAEPEDEQGASQALVELIRRVGLVEHFENESWYTTGLGSSEPLASSATEDVPITGGQRVKVEGREAASAGLNYHALDHLTRSVDGWDETLRTEIDASKFIIKKLEGTYGIQVQAGFAELPIESQLQEFLEFITYHRESYYSRTWQYTSPYGESVLTKDYKEFLPLLGLVKPGPLICPDALAESFDFNTEGHAVEYLRRHVELVYAEKGYELPEDWSAIQDSVQLANLLYSVLEEIKVHRESDESYDIEFGLDYKFHDAYGLQGSDVNRDFARLAGVHHLPDYSLFVFVVSMLWEPADWAITIAEMGDDIAKGDGLSALIKGVVGLLPGALGRIKKQFRSADEITDSFRWFDGADVNRRFPEHVREDMMSGRATRPMWGRGHGKVEGILEDVNPKAPRQMQDQIRVQNEVAELLADEGYHVVSLGPHGSSHRLKAYDTLGNKPIGEPDLVIWQALSDGTHKPRYFDVYSPVTVRVDTIERELRRKAGKLGGTRNIESTAGSRRGGSGGTATYASQASE